MRNTYYGMTAQQGQGARLDGHGDKVSPIIEAPTLVINGNTIPIDCDPEILAKHIERAEKILRDLMRLWIDRKLDSGTKDLPQKIVIDVSLRERDKSLDAVLCH